MILTIASFEFRQRITKISSWVYFTIFFTISFLWIAAAGGLFKDANISFGSGKVFINSPFAVAQTTAILGLLATSIIAAIMGRAVQQDFEYRTESFFFTAPITKVQYLGGRFLGALAVAMVIFASIPLGSWIATYLPGLDLERLGPRQFNYYIVPYLLILLPNCIWLGAVFFNLAALARKMLPVYIGSVLVLIGWLLSARLLSDLDNQTMAAMIDPFGSRAMSTLTKYWTISERNTRMVPMEGVLLWNRMLWLSVALVVSLVCGWFFTMTHYAERISKRKRNADLAPDPDAIRQAVVLAPPKVTRAAVKPWRLILPMVGIYVGETVKNVYFVVLVLAGILFMIAASTTLGARFDTQTWPVTFEMLDILGGSFGIFMLIIIAFYAGEMVWREREHRFDQIVDATPTPTWLPFIAKLLALMVIPLLLQVLLMICGMGIQLSKGYTHLQPGLYLHDLLGIHLIDYWIICALALSIHSVINQKYVGHFVVIVYYVAVIFASALGFENNLYRFGNYPDLIYSDMNGYGPFLFRARIFQSYWAAASVILLVIAYAFWTRGTMSGWRERIVVARARMRGAPTMILALAFVVFVGLGAFIYYNTAVLNHYLTASALMQRRADYEKKYKVLAAEPQLKPVAVSVDVELYPSQGRVRLRGHYDLENRNTVPVSTVNLVFESGDVLIVHQLMFGVPADLVEADMPHAMQRFRFKEPLAPGAKTTLAFDIELPTRGFQNEATNTSVVANGTFFNSRLLLPYIGYWRDGELDRDQDRRKFNLPPRERALPRDDPMGAQRDLVTPDSDWIQFDATVSTEADQIAISPGYLQREWTEGGRRHFAYKMDIPIQNFFAFQSARYAVRHDVWHDQTGKRDVNLDVYYQPGHEFNIDGMIAASKASLGYCSANFGDYQYNQFRILEFPRYASFAQSFANTVPFSEAIGFVARVRPNDPSDIDYPYYVTAHEAAHQWWAHQVAAADVQGGTMLIETLAQYSALMVMKHRYGEGKMRKFLSYELDSYLTGRAIEQKKEVPLAFVENQAYIHYRKGSVVMYALQDYIGEDRVNEAIRRYRDQYAFKAAPYPTTRALIDNFRAVTPPELQYVITDMFESIILYENRALSATGRKLPNGKFEVTMKVHAHKVRADESGHEEPVTMNDFIDIGVIDEHGDAISVKKERISTEESTFTVIVDQKPARAGIDPLNKLIDRNPRDNTIAIDWQS